MPEFLPTTDINAPELDIFARLSEPELRHYYEPDGGLFIAESPRVALRALSAGMVPVSVLTDPRSREPETEDFLSRCGDIPIYTAPPEVLVKITGFHLTRGLLCAMKRPSLPAPEKILKAAERLVVLENVVNPTNLGAIFRSAAALGMDAILLTPACTDPFYRRAARVSMGTVFQIPWTRLSGDETAWPGEGLSLLREYHLKTAAMALTDNSVNINDRALMAEKKIAVILGTEGDGLLPETIEASDYTVCIPMMHGADSLNVAAASAVAFWQLGRSR